ncbi:MAG: hypothetical protein AMJ46_01100 [Latescibacteria bacterium DG_63]|nr:MAG: hypothetical protein AMJ46_01100 [Latescibacteria bacterium DG_63]
MSQQIRYHSGSVPSPLLLLFVACCLLIFSLLSSPVAAQEAIHPDFLDVTCGDRIATLSWSSAVEDRLAEIRDSLAALGQPVPNQFKFGGYEFWRGEAPDTSRMMLLRKFTRRDSVSWTFRGNLRQFVDPDSIFEIRLVRTQIGFDSVYVRMRVSLDVPGPFNGLGYYYAVTYFDSTGTRRSAKLDCYTFLPVHPVAEQDRSIERVWVVPNPYHISSPWDASEGRRIQFINLPPRATVKIYTVSGELVASLEHPDPDYFNYGSFGGARNWDLTNQYGEEVVPGVYIFYAEGEGGEQYKGHFVIIR